MDYFYDKNASIIRINTNPEVYKDKKKLSEILMPESYDSEGVKFNTAGLMSLSELISHISEKDMLYFVYVFLKTMAEWNEKTDPSLMLITDIEAVFYDQKKNRFLFAAKDSDGTSLNQVGFVTDIIFEAVYKEKELQVAAELISFIRASIHTSPRDVVLFLEMSKYGRSFVSDWTKIKKTFETPTGHTDSLAESHKNKMLSKVNNSMDFSDFLSVDDLFSDASTEEKADEPVQKTAFSRPEPEAYKPEPEAYKPEPEAYKPEPEVYEPEPEVYEPEPEVYEPEHEVYEPEHEVYEPKPEVVPEPVQEDLHVQYVVPEHKDEIFVAQESFEDEDADIPYSESGCDEVYEDIPLNSEPVDEPLENFKSETESDEVADKQEEEYYPVGVEECDEFASEYEDDDQTVILTEDECYENTVTAFLTDANGTKIFVNKDYFVVGRNSKESDFSIRDSSMSRRHAAIIKIGEEFYIEDLNSMNKTYLNGEQVMPNSRKRLADGSEILLSRNKLIFNITVDVERR